MPGLQVPRGSNIAYLESHYLPLVSQRIRKLDTPGVTMRTLADHCVTATSTLGKLELPHALIRNLEAYF